MKFKTKFIYKIYHLEKNNYKLVSEDSSETDCQKMQESGQTRPWYLKGAQCQN